jgi:hypothetical protein
MRCQENRPDPIWTYGPEEEAFFCRECAEKEGLVVEWSHQPHNEFEKEVKI